KREDLDKLKHETPDERAARAKFRFLHVVIIATEAKKGLFSLPPCPRNAVDTLTDGCIGFRLRRRCRPNACFSHPIEGMAGCIIRAARRSREKYLSQSRRCT